MPYIIVILLLIFAVFYKQEVIKEIKYVNRQTGKTTFDLIKDYKSGWKAFWSNNTAKLFNIDLKKTYDPMEVPEDFYIETYLQRSFDEGKLIKQEAKKPISENELILNWTIKNREELKVGN